jgi:hypothetical protein
MHRIVIRDMQQRLGAPAHLVAHKANTVVATELVSLRIV